jgi:hypothetical protein
MRLDVFHFVGHHTTSRDCSDAQADPLSPSSYYRFKERAVSIAITIAPDLS